MKTDPTCALKMKNTNTHSLNGENEDRVLGVGSDALN